MAKPRLGFWGLWNISFGFFGIQIGLALQNGNMSRIFQTLGASVDDLPILWIAGPATGLLVQPIVGYLSDRTWGRFGRRRPFFLAGAVLASIALLLMPNSGALWMAAGLLWILDASINVSMEPFRAFVGDMLGKAQHTTGYAFQAAFIGVGSVVGSLAPQLIAGAMGGAGEGVPLSLKIAFAVGAAMLLGAVLWTVLTTREYSPDELAGFERAEAIEQATGHAPLAVPATGFLWLAAGLALGWAVWQFGFDNPVYVLAAGLALFGLAQLATRARLAGGAASGALAHILSDLHAMPQTMRRLALTQFFSWSGLFVLWIFTTPVVTQYAFGTTDAASARFNEGADWVGVLFSVYNGVAALWAVALPFVAGRVGRAHTHALGLVAGAAGFAGLFAVRDPMLLMLPMVGIGIAWASILTMPYAILVDALPPRKLGIYMGLFNIFIVVPQLVVSTIMGEVSRSLFPGDPVNIMLVGAATMLVAAATTLRLPR